MDTETLQEKTLWLAGKMHKRKEEIQQLVDGVVNQNIVPAEKVKVQGYTFRNEDGMLMAYNADFEEWDLVVFKDLKDIIDINAISFYTILGLFIDEVE